MLEVTLRSQQCLKGNLLRGDDPASRIVRCISTQTLPSTLTFIENLITRYCLLYAFTLKYFTSTLMYVWCIILSAYPWFTLTKVVVLPPIPLSWLLLIIWFCKFFQQGNPVLQFFCNFASFKVCCLIIKTALYKRWKVKWFSPPSPLTPNHRAENGWWRRFWGKGGSDLLCVGGRGVGVCGGGDREQRGQ